MHAYETSVCLSVFRVIVVVGDSFVHVAQTNVCTHWREYVVGDLCCCLWCTEYTHIHISFDLGVVVWCCMRNKARAYTQTKFMFVNMFDLYIDKLLGNLFIYTLDSGFVF